MRFFSNPFDNENFQSSLQIIKYLIRNLDSFSVSKQPASTRTVV